MAAYNSMAARPVPQDPNDPQWNKMLQPEQSSGNMVDMLKVAYDRLFKARTDADNAGQALRTGMTMPTPQLSRTQEFGSRLAGNISQAIAPSMNGQALAERAIGGQNQQLGSDHERVLSYLMQQRAQLQGRADQAEQQSTSMRFADEQGRQERRRATIEGIQQRGFTADQNARDRQNKLDIASMDRAAAARAAAKAVATTHGLDAGDALQYEHLGATIEELHKNLSGQKKVDGNTAKLRRALLEAETRQSGIIQQHELRKVDPAKWSHDEAVIATAIPHGYNTDPDYTKAVKMFLGKEDVGRQRKALENQGYNVGAIDRALKELRAGTPVEPVSNKSSTPMAGPAGAVAGIGAGIGRGMTFMENQRQRAVDVGIKATGVGMTPEQYNQFLNSLLPPSPQGPLGAPMQGTQGPPLSSMYDGPPESFAGPPVPDFYSDFAAPRIIPPGGQEHTRRINRWGF